MILLLLAHPTLAADLDDLRAAATLAVDAAPNLTGETDLRARQAFDLAAPLHAAWALSAAGALRQGSAIDGTVDLYGLRLAGEGSLGTLELGRLLSLDPRGLAHLDGLRLTGANPRLRPALWLGRLWSPEAGAQPNTEVAGLGLDLRSVDDEGAPNGRAGLSLGVEAQRQEAALHPHAFGAARLAGPKGGAATLDGEYAPGQGQRAGLRAQAPLGRHLRLGPTLRWEDLALSTQASAPRDAIDWLSPEGYGVASLLVVAQQGPLTATLDGGPVYHPDGDPGGLLTAHLDAAAARRLQLGLFGLGAGMGGSAVAGGGLRAAYAPEPLDLQGELGLYRWTPLSGAAATIGEARLRLATPLGAHLHAQAELDGGADRLLRPYLRGGLALTGALGPEAR